MMLKGLYGSWFDNTKPILIFRLKRAIVHSMHRFGLTFFFIMLNLGQTEACAQQNATPTDAPVPAIAEKNERPAEKRDDEKEKAVEPNNDISVIANDVERPEISVLDRSDELAEKANRISFWQAVFGFFTLVFAGLATLFACGAWREAKRGVSVTRDIGQKQTQAYLSVKSAILWVPVANGEKGWFSKNDVFKFTLKAIFENTGNTPGLNVSYKFKVRLFGGGKNLLVSDFGNTHSYGIVGHNRDTSGTLKYAVSTEVPAEGSDSIKAIDVRTCYITIRAEYSDVFENRWYIESTFEGAPFTAAGGTADNVKDLALDHMAASDKHGKIKKA